MNAGVESFADDIFSRGVHADVQADLRVFGGEARDDGCKYRRRREGVYRQPKLACWLVAECIDRVERLMNAFENRSQVCEQLLAGFGQRDASRGAVEQSNAELFF